MKPSITLSINPSYYCNLRCDFCYLTHEQLGNKQRLDLSQLATRLDEVEQYYDIQMVDLYGGETFMLPESYLLELKELLLSRGIDDINVITNLTVKTPFIHDPDLYISVSYDFKAREKHEVTFERMLELSRPFTVLMLCSPELLKEDPDEIIQTLNLLANLENVEVKPYSSNQSNQLNVTYNEYEAFVKALITSKIPKQFTLTNELHIEDALSGERNAFSNDHLYITPNGKFGVLEFDRDENEFFLELDSVEAYQEWCALEYQRVQDNLFCSGCPYFGNCLSEHLREVKNLDNGCNGFYHLLKWAETENLYHGDH